MRRYHAPQPIPRLAVLLTVLILAACAAGLGNLEPPNVTLSNVAPAPGMTVFEQRYDVTLRPRRA